MSQLRLIVISQVITPAFANWLEVFATENGPVELWTGVDLVKDSANIAVRRLPAYNRTSYRTRLLGWVRFALIVTFALITKPRKVPVLGITNPPFMPLILWLHRLVLGRRYGIVEYDIYPQIMVTMGLLTAQSLIYRVWYAWHKQALRRANLIITLSDLMADELRTMAGEELTQLVVIPTWTDTDRIKPMARTINPFALEHGLSAELVVLYSGNLGVTHSIETIIQVAECLKDEPTIQFVVIGSGAKYALVEAAVSSKRTPTLTLLPLQPVEKLPYSFASADLAFVTLARGYERLSLPSKTYDMMAAGCAIAGVSQAGSGLDLLLSKHVCGKNFDPEQPDLIAAWILELANNRQKLHELQTNARQAAVDHYSAVHCSVLLTREVRQKLLT